MGKVVNLDDIHYLLEAGKVVGVKDKRSGVTIETTCTGDLMVTGGLVRRKCLDDLLTAWLCMSRPDVINFDEEG